MNENMLPVGTLLRGGTYRIEKQIGAGGFGNTYVVRNQNFDEFYAMKEFFMKGINLRNGNDVTVSVTDNKATFESQRDKFKKEAKRLHKLTNEHIVKVHDLFEENGTVYYTMDYIEGQSLADIVKGDGPMEGNVAMDVFYQILNALSVVHSQEPMMLHLDIKPSNIMLDKSGKAFLLDFGSSKQIDNDNSYHTSTAFTYTPGYAPSEVIDGNKNRIGPWSDMYELGATLYHILTGQQPPTISEISEDGEDAFIFQDNISKKEREIICWMMALSRAKRPQSVEEILNKLGIEAEPTKKKKPENQVNQHKTGIDNDDNDKTILNIPKTKIIKYNGNNPILQNLVNNMVYVEGGTFTMGATSEQYGVAEIDEKPPHEVYLSSFHIGRFEVTQEEWETVMGSNPSYHKGAKHPVENVCWNDCQVFISKLNAMTGMTFRLPTEAEWEYAARGGRLSEGNRFSGGKDVELLAWYHENSNNMTHPVGKKSHNELDLYDMSGNVHEWCNDGYNQYHSEKETNPTRAQSSLGRVIRGGSFYNGVRHCRVSYRNYCVPNDRNINIGMRLAI